MNCCDESGRCRCPLGSRLTRVNTLTDLPAGGIRFAPGAIEHTRRPWLGTRDQRRALRRSLKLAAFAVAMCAAAAGGGMLFAGLLRLF